VTSRLGLRAARDSAKVGPYRFLCYLVGLVTLVAIVWGWGGERSSSSIPWSS